MGHAVINIAKEKGIIVSNPDSFELYLVTVLDPSEIDFMAISSYGGQTDSSGVVRILKDLDMNIKGRDVLVVEDIIDSVEPCPT